MKTSPAQGAVLPALPFHPIEGLEAEDAPYIAWLLAGGKPITTDECIMQWADTQKEAA